MSRLRAARWIAISLCLMVSSSGAVARAASEQRAGDSEQPAADPTADGEVRQSASSAVAESHSQPLAIGASIVPGVVLHGSGSWVLGERDAAARLLLMEGLGIGGVLLSGTGLALTGAARATVAPLALLSVISVNLVVISFATDLYNTLAPDEGWGRPRLWSPMLRAKLGYVYVVDPIFDYSHLLTHALMLREGPWAFGYQGWHAPNQGHARARAGISYGIWGSHSGRSSTDGSYLDVEVAVGGQQFDDADFDVVSADTQVKTRFDAHRIVPQVEGAFFELAAGVGVRRTTFRSESALQTDSLLLARTAFGIYFGDGESADSTYGEWQMYYDHRHDDFAAGLKAEGLGSGVAGHIGTSLQLDLTRRFGVEAYTEFGSAWVNGAMLTLREDGR